MNLKATLTLTVVYSGIDADGPTVKAVLQSMVEHASDNGLLSGGFDMEVEESSFDIETAFDHPVLAALENGENIAPPNRKGHISKFDAHGNMMDTREPGDSDWHEWASIFGKKLAHYNVDEIELSDGGCIEVPDRDGRIRRRDRDGNCEEIREIGEDDWQEWAILFDVTEADFKEDED